jgi:UDP-N-acetylmuramoylalanine-D-glutamate ligase
LDSKFSKDYLENLQKYDIIYKSPGISVYLPQIQQVKDKIFTNLDIFLENFS